MKVNMTKHRKKKTYAQKKPNASLVIFIGGSNIEIHYEAIEREVRESWSSRMGSRIALKIRGSLSRAIICRSMERHAVIESRRSHCQSIITSFLSVRVAKKMEKKTWCFLQGSLQGIPSLGIVWLFSSVKAFNHPSRWSGKHTFAWPSVVLWKRN